MRHMKEGGLIHGRTRLQKYFFCIMVLYPVFWLPGQKSHPFRRKGFGGSPQGLGYNYDFSVCFLVIKIKRGYRRVYSGV